MTRSGNERGQTANEHTASERGEKANEHTASERGETTNGQGETASGDGDVALVAARADEPPVETDEVRALARAAGYDVRGELTQVRPEDPGTYLGAGKVEEVADRAAAAGASLVVVDDQLTPRQTVSLREAMPEGVRVFDRYRLVLAIFADQAETRRAGLQVELARLRYERPRLVERSDVQGLNRFTEKGTPIDGVDNRIADLERKLDDLPTAAEQHRERHREQGFDLVSLAGYTNAGKSTLLHRLADEMDLSDAVDDDGDDASGADETVAGSPDRPATDPTAAVEDRLFKTLETTTRRATLDGRPVLCTDTVGFVDDLPHWLVESFSSTLSDAAAADAVVLVADASDPPAEIRRKIGVSLDVLDAQDVDDTAVVTALNKVDLLDEGERRERVDAAAEALPAAAADPVPVSALEGTNVDALVAAVTERLPTERAEVTLPNCDEAMSLVSLAYDRATVEAVEYEGEAVRLAFAGRPGVVAKLQADAAAVSRP